VQGAAAIAHCISHASSTGSAIGSGPEDTCVAGRAMGSDSAGEVNGGDQRSESAFVQERKAI